MGRILKEDDQSNVRPASLDETDFREDAPPAASPRIPADKVNVSNDGPRGPDARARGAVGVWNDGEIELDDPSVVFQPFYSARPQHLGLGLPIAAHIAEQHDGSLRLSTNSVADGGTCFTLQV